MTKLLKNKFIIFFVIFVFTEPACFGAYGIDKLFTLSKLLICAVILFIYLSQKKITRFMLVMISLQMVLVFSTFINNADLIKSVINAVNIIAICMYAELVAKACPKNIFQILYYVLGAYIVINLLTVVLLPNGLYILKEKNYVYYFLGYRNNFILTLLPYMCVGVVYNIYRKRKFPLDFMIVSVLGIFSIIKVWSATSIVGILLFCGYLIVFYKRENGKLFNLQNYAIFNLIGCWCVVIWRVQEKFAFIIESVLKRSANFTGRTNIWDRAISYFLDSPIYGNGIEPEAIVTQKFGGTEAIHAHNFYLDIAYKGGILALSLFIAILFMCARKVNKYRKKNITKIISATLFIYLFMFQVEAYPTLHLFYMLLTFSYHIDKLIEEEQLKLGGNHEE